jgi:transcriptional regulator with XRE-family HTH domain
MSSTYNYGITATASGQSTTTPSSLWRQLAESKKFREEFNALQMKRGVAFQIRALLKKRRWTQGKLADCANLTQGVVSRAQDPDYGNLTINTINRLAAGFDVAFIGRFVPFTELVDWFENLSEEAGEVRSFEKENKEILQGRISTSRTRHRSRRKRVKQQNLITRIRRAAVPIGRKYGAKDITPSGEMQQSQLALQGLGEPKVVLIPPPEEGGAGVRSKLLYASKAVEGANQWKRKLSSNSR